MEGLKNIPVLLSVNTYVTYPRSDSTGETPWNITERNNKFLPLFLVSVMTIEIMRKWQALSMPSSALYRFTSFKIEGKDMACCLSLLYGLCLAGTYQNAGIAPVFGYQ